VASKEDREILAASKDTGQSYLAPGTTILNEGGWSENIAKYTCERIDTPSDTPPEPVEKQVTKT